jgi:ATP-binding cassette subfamily B protein
MKFDNMINHIKRIFFRKRVRVIHQLTQNECGAACLAMILSYHGYNLSIAECSEYCDPGRDGLTAHTILQAARHFGLRAKAFSVNLKDFKYINLPAIIHWNFKHYVVVEKWHRQHVWIIDPAVGRCQLNTRQFDEGFTGVTLVFEPGSQFRPRRRKQKSLWMSYLKEIFQIPNMLNSIIQVLLISLLLQIFGLAVPLLTKIFFDNVIPFSINNIMLILAMGIILLVVNKIIITYLRGLLFIYIRNRIDSQMIAGFFEHVLSLPFRFFHKLSSGDLMMRLNSNTVIRQALTNQTISIILDGSFVMVYLAIIFTQSLLFGCVVTTFGVLQFLIIFFARNKIKSLMQRELASSADTQSYLVEALRGIATLKASGTEDRAYDHWSNLFFKQLNTSLIRAHFTLLLDIYWTTLQSLWPMALLWLGTQMILNNNMSIGTMLALYALAGSFLAPLSALVSAGQQLQLISAYLERVDHVIDIEPEQSNLLTNRVLNKIVSLDLKNITFRYDKNSTYAIKNITLSIKPGQKIAIVGKTGAGKSTLAMTLLGLYMPEYGEILYNGISHRLLNLKALRSQFGVVLQESFLFNGSVRQNIAFNNPEMPLLQVEKAAQLATIHNEIISLPMAYETLVSEGGVGFSGGQRQRLSIARAVAHNPSLLLLDEATSHLDAVTEALIDKNLDTLKCTRVIIAHRLSTIKNADLIVVLDRGSVVDLGKHHDLLNNCSYYHSLMSHQVDERITISTSLIDNSPST